MNSFLPHQYRNFSSSGFQTNRPVFQNKIERHIPTGHEKKEKMRLKEKEAGRLKKEYEKERDAEAKMYFSLKYAFREAEQEPEDFRLELRMEDLVAMRKEVKEGGRFSRTMRDKIGKEILNIDAWMKTKVKKPWHTADSTYEKEHNEEADKKKIIKGLLKGPQSKYETQLIKYEQARRKFEKINEKTYTKFQTNVERFITSGKALEKLKGNKNFKSIMGAYELAVTSPVWKSAEFAMFQENKDRTEDAQVTKEYRQLFLSLMHAETHNYTTNFALGPEFSNNPQTNKEKFPYIYKLWLEKSGSKKDLETRARAEQEIRAIKKDLPPISNGLKTVLGMPNLPDLTTNPQNIEEADKNYDQINLFHSHHHEERENLLDPLKNSFEDDKKIIEKHLKLANVQRKLMYAMANIENADKHFTADYLSQSGYQQEVVELCLLKFKKAKNIVDSVFADARLSEQYHPAVKRLLIALIYKNGVTEYVPKKNGTPDFNDRTEHYASILRAILNSNRFNSNEPGQMLSKEQIDFLTIAIKRGAELGTDLEKIEKRRRKSDVYTENVKTYIEMEMQYRQYPEELRNLAEGATGAYDALPAIYKPLFTADGKLHSRAKELEIALVNNDQGKLDALESDFPKPLPSYIHVSEAINTGIALTSRNNARINYESELAGNRNAIKRAKETLVREEMKFLNTNNDFVSMAMYLRDPDNPIGQEWFEGATLQLATNNEKLRRESHDIYLHYNTLELRSRGVEHMLKTVIGIEFRGLYENYTKEVAENPRLDVSNWTELFQSNNLEDRKALIELLRKIVPNDRKGGKNAFLFILENMQNHDILSQVGRTDIQNNDPELSALAILGLIKTQIDKEKKIAASTAAKKFEYAKRLKGKSITDYAEHYVGMAWDMLTGSRSKASERIAGFFAFYMTLKAVKKAFGPNPGPMGNALKLGLGVLVVDALKKKGTGTGLIESMSVHNIANAFEGTDVAALVKHGSEIAKEGDIEINEEQQHEAIQQMANVPFHKLVEWYEFVEKSPGENKKPGRGRKDPFKAFKINTRAIFKHNKTLRQDPDLVGREAVYKTLKSFFSYVGNQAGEDADYGKKALEARWINPLQPGGTTELADKRYTSWISANLLKPHVGNPDSLKWEKVMKVEITRKDATDTIDDNWISKTVNFVDEARQTLTDYARVEILHPSKAKLDKFFENTRVQYAPETKKWIYELAETGAAKMDLGTESVKIWYEGHKVGIRRFFGKHWELLKTAGKLPFELIIALDSKVIDWADSAIRRLRGMFVEKYGQREIGIPLLEEDLNDGFFKIGLYRSYLGNRYADQFHEALTEPGKLHIDEVGVNQKILDDIDSRYPEYAELTDNKPSEDLLKYYKNRPKNVAYFITEVDESVIPSHIKSPYDRHLYLKIEAEKQARRQIKEELRNINEALPDEEKRDLSPYNNDFFDDYLYAITEVAKVGAAGPGQPEKLYVFYRLPLADSPEVLMKESGKWHDSLNPRVLKNHPPFIANPDDDIVTNFRNAFGREWKGMKPAGRWAGILAAQLLRASLWTAERITSLGEASRYTRWMHIDPKDDFYEMIDRSLTSAQYPWSALSEYYSSSPKDRRGRLTGRRINKATADRNRFNYNKALKEADEEE